MRIILTIIITLPILLRDIKSGYLLFRLKDNKQVSSASRSLGKKEENITEYSFILKSMTSNLYFTDNLCKNLRA